MSNAANPPNSNDAQAYLPDFCAGATILIVLLVAELVAIVLTIAAQTAPGSFLTDLAIISLYVLWLALLSCAVLCRARRWVEQTGKTRGFVIAFLLLVLLCLALAEVAWQITSRFGGATLIADSHGGFLLRTFAISAIVIALAMRYLYISSEWRRSIVQEAEARISALQALIRPHFLFNTMNTIVSLVRSAPESAERAIEDLSDLLRANLATTNNRVSLAEEREVAGIYERIEKLRLGDRLQVSWQLDELPGQALLPSLTLQPLLENAIYHGVEQLPEGGEISVKGTLKNKRLKIEIRNPRPQRQRRSTGHRMALENIRQRFELAYSGTAEVRIEESDDAYGVILSFPLETRDT
ncbi:MAG: histidine kinase [Woeseia sp.]|nr:histidine kinase [Woeseia sp.]MBT8096448.1 histidine kinase [Woeseia sp.]NNE60060.1 histidine kinase [Woeseia sp.]NNL55992.1 histidine kinase [Woeseia sp.]